MTTPAAAPVPSAMSVVDKHLTSIMNCMQNVVYVMMLLHFLETGMFWICFAAHTVSPMASWKGLFYNMWFSLLVAGIMLAFKGTLEVLIIFENLKRNKDGKNDATTTIIAVNKNEVAIKHVDNGSNSTAWQAVAGFILHKYFEKDETAKNASTQNEEEATTPSSTTAEDEIKQDAASASSSAEDEIKQDAASASSSTRSGAATSDARN